MLFGYLAHNHSILNFKKNVIKKTLGEALAMGGVRCRYYRSILLNVYQGPVL